MSDPADSGYECCGKPMLAIVSYEVYQGFLEVIDALQETLEMCQNPEHLAHYATVFCSDSAR